MSQPALKNYKIVAVGGTGQMVMHYYLQLHLLGVIKHHFDLVVVDSDEILPSIQVMGGFFKELQYGSQSDEGFGKTRIPTVETVGVKPVRGDSAHEVLTGSKTWKKPEPHPTHAFFNQDTLRQNLKQGLFARPALSSLLSQDVFLEDALKPRADSMVVIVGAVTGGTGGGLTAPLLDAIGGFARRERAQGVKIRAVLFGEYFRPQSGKIQDDVLRFQSNQILVLRSICEAEAWDYLHSYYIVGGPGFKGDFERHADKEKEGKNLPWPKEEMDPFWQGVQALEYLLADSISEKRVKFENREVTKFNSNINLKHSQSRLRKAVEMVAMLRKKSAITRMCRDPWARWIWGERLFEIVSHYWNIAANKEGGIEGVSNFPNECQHALDALWRGEGASMGLQGVFPNPPQRQIMRPGKMAGIGWPRPTETSLERDLFNDSQETARRAAATILYWTLREVE
jgi:hypothetical protein